MCQWLEGHTIAIVRIDRVKLGATLAFLYLLLFAMGSTLKGEKCSSGSKVFSIGVGPILEGLHKPNKLEVKNVSLYIKTDGKNMGLYPYAVK